MAKKIQKFVVVMIAAENEYFVSDQRIVKVKENTWRIDYSFNDNTAMFFDDMKQAEESAHELMLQQSWNKFVVRPVKIG